MRTLEEIARERIIQCRREILFALKTVRDNNPFAAETDSRRRQRRIQTKLNISSKDAAVIDAELSRRSSRIRNDIDEEDKSKTFPEIPEAIWGDTVDFVKVAFLERGAQVARSVCRVAYHTGRAQGTGVLIGGGLVLTNHHVVASEKQAAELVVEFDYERDLFGAQRQPTRFTLDPTVFVFDPVSGLDFTVCAVGKKIDGPGELDGFGYSPLSDATDKHMIGEFANIIQHPQGRFKEVVLRENRLVSRFDNALHYVADTERGSSGSPVYNSEWRMANDRITPLGWALDRWGTR